MNKLFLKKEKKSNEKKDKENKKEKQVIEAAPVKKGLTEKKVVRFLDKLTDRILIFLCIILLCLGGYALLDTIHIYYHANDTSLLTYKPQVESDGTVRDPLSLPGAVGWLTLDGTQVDYPVMQGMDNSSYLNKDPYGNYSLSGSLFLDANNSPNFTDQYSMIYGHHMEHNSMFGALDEYLKADYFEKHRSGSIIIGSKSYKLVLFAALETSAYTKEIFDVKNGGALNYIRENAEIFYPDDVTDYDQILAMSTCQEADSDQRTVIFAVVVGGPGTLNSDGSQKSTTAGDNINTGEKGNGSVYFYWGGLFTAIAIGIATFIFMRNGKKNKKTVSYENSEVLDAVYSPSYTDTGKTEHQPMAPPSNISIEKPLGMSTEDRINTTIPDKKIENKQDTVHDFEKEKVLIDQSVEDKPKIEPDLEHGLKESTVPTKAENSKSIQPINKTKRKSITKKPTIQKESNQTKDSAEKPKGKHGKKVKAKQETSEKPIVRKARAKTTSTTESAQKKPAGKITKNKEPSVPKKQAKTKAISAEELSAQKSTANVKRKAIKEVKKVSNKKPAGKAKKPAVKPKRKVKPAGNTEEQS